MNKVKRPPALKIGKPPKNFLTFRADHPLYITKEDREWKGAWHDIERKGYAGTEVSDLQYALACFILPRLCDLRKVSIGYPSSVGSFEMWIAMMDEMIYAMDYIVQDKCGSIMEEERVRKGCALLGEHFQSLWD